MEVGLSFQVRLDVADLLLIATDDQIDEISFAPQTALSPL